MLFRSHACEEHGRADRLGYRCIALACVALTLKYKYTLLQASIYIPQASHG